MLDITKLLSLNIEKDSIRYDKGCNKSTTGVKEGKGPVVVWNITHKCNYKCEHCYSNSGDSKEEFLSLKEVKRIVDELALEKVPVILLSGGEPLMRKDIFTIIQYIKEKDINVSLSTNGSLIDDTKAALLKKIGVGYVGISIDGNEEINDRFRGVKGAFSNSLRAIKSCKSVNQKVGLRFTLQKNNFKEIPYILELMEQMDIKRICFYHLVPQGRGKEIQNKMLSSYETRSVIDYLYNYCKDEEVNREKEILTVDNHADAPYLYLKLLEEDKEKAGKVLDLLKINGGNRSGMALVSIDWRGNVYPDQFSHFLKLGNLKEKSFQKIWHGDNELMHIFRNRKSILKGKCANCRWSAICNGNLRARAYSISEDIWGEDPGCYLKESEI